jgi:hypothetical protein
MRSFLRNIALAAFALWASHANALPMTPIPGASGVTQIQLQCTTASCIDPRTGVYTQSTCDRYGCRPSSGPVGRLGSGGGYRNGPPLEPPPSYYGRQYGRGDYGGGGGGFDCNASRCIDGNGRVWESTCNRRGCRPLRPARGSRW